MITANRRFECTTNGSNKYWEVQVSGNTVYLKYGAIGTKGQQLVKSFNSNYAAAEYARDAIHEKTGKGYYEKAVFTITPVVSSPAPTVLSQRAKIRDSLNTLTTELLEAHDSLSYVDATEIRKRLNALLKIVK